ncbi:MAG: NAD(P)-dependent oxidoreductase [Hyphomicrobiales bacterium]|nr:NAD(P)-dependent oxidoreductase [Hyphomicrobiales bacterium]
MAARLLEGGHDVSVFNRTPSKADAIVQAGARRAASVAEAATHGDLVITMLENDTALEMVTLGDHGLAESLPHGRTHVAMGTHSLAMIEALSAAHTDKGQVLVSAPVLGRPPAAQAGQLGIIAAGPADAIEACSPLFAQMGRRTFLAGENPVSGAAAKIANNFLLACAIEAMGEAFILAEKCGADLDVFYDLVTDGLFSSPAYKIYGKMIADKAYFGEPGFTATTGLKDLNLALAAGQEFAVPLPSGNVARDHILSAIASGNGELDWTVMALEQAKASGVAVKREE